MIETKVTVIIITLVYFCCVKLVEYRGTEDMRLVAT